MTDLRTLPIRLEPLEGEALDSWFEAFAYRMHMPVRALLASLGLRQSTDQTLRDPKRTSWIVMLQRHEAESIASVTGVDVKRLESMTLASYDGRALLVNTQSREVNRRRLWGRNAGSRFCPYCLTETEGRWNLSWRLGWSFACLRHQCLLLDACPGCDRIQRIRGFGGDRPIHPAYCAYPVQDGSLRARCGADLRQAVSVRFGEGHPVLNAQRIVFETIEAGQATFGVYAYQSVAARNALADVRAIAARALTPTSADGLGKRLPGDLLPLYLKSAAQPRTTGSRGAYVIPGRMAPPRSAVAAAGVIAAVEVLGQPNVQRAGSALRWLTIGARTQGHTVTPSTTAAWGRGTSPALYSVSLASMGPVLKPSHKLRYRVTAESPGPPDNALTRFDSLVRSTPTLLWPFWAVRLAPRNVSGRLIRAALSAFLLLPGTRASLEKSTARLGGAVGKIDASRILQVIEDTPQGEGILTALMRLSDHLADHPAPIDYERRRALDYTDLLPDSEWDQICRATGAIAGSGRRVHLARAYLRQRLSTLPQGDPPPSLTYSLPAAFRLELAEFPVLMFPELCVALDAAGQKYLARHGITGEPMTWQPPLILASGLDLPGPDPSSIDTAGLHQMIYAGNAPGKVAQTIGITTDSVRLILGEYPAPARRIQRKRGRLPGPRMRFSMIAKDDLERLYLHERLSIRKIAAHFNTSKPVIADLLRSHGIPIGPKPPVGVTPDWLRQEYLDKGRSFRDLAREVDCGPGALAEWARRYGLPIRPRGGSYSADRSPETKDGSGQIVCV